MHIENLQNKNIKWWKHLIAFALIVVTIIVGQLPFEILLFSRKTQLNISEKDFRQILTDMDWQVLNISENLFLIVIMIPFLLLFLLLKFVFPKILKTSFLSIITGRKTFDYNRFFLSLVIWFVLANLFTFIFLDWQYITVQFHFQKFLVLCAISLLLLPIQTAVEEILFRGYIMQLCFLLTKHKMFSLAIVTLLFALMHMANPEFQHDFYKIFPVYLFLSLIFGVLTILDNGLEIPIGLHAGNNIFTALILSTNDGAMKTPSVFRTDVEHLIAILPELLFVLSLVSLVVLFYKYRWKLKMLF